MRRFLAPWDRYSQMIHLGRDKDGNQRFINVGFTDPWSYLREPILAAMSGNDPEQKFHDITEALAGPFLGESMITERVVDALRNTTVSGRRVYSESATSAEKVVGSFKHIAGSLEPGFVTSGRRLVMGKTGEVTRTGRSYDFNDEAVALVTGQRRQKLDVRQSLIFRSRDARAKIMASEGELRDKLRDRSNVSDQDIVDAYRASEERRRYFFKQLSDDAQAAISLGVNEREVRKILADSGVPKDQIRLALTGDYRPYEPNNAFFKRALRRGLLVEGPGTEGEAKMREFREQLSRRRRLIRDQ